VPPFKSSTAFRALAPTASFRGRFASLRFRPKNLARHIFQLESELQNIPEAAPRASRSFSGSEKLARYGSSALSGVEHLTLLVGKESVALALIRHFGSLLLPLSLVVLVVDSADAFAVHRSPFRPRACQNPFCRSSLCALCASVVNPSPSVASGTSSEIFSMQAPSEAQIAATNVRLHRMYRAAQRYLFRLSLRYSYRPGVTSACRHNILAA
jgi:hypothetical protein